MRTAVVISKICSPLKKACDFIYIKIVSCVGNKMIVTVKDDFDKDQGTDLPMFSRVGKTTVSMYIAFS